MLSVIFIQTLCFIASARTQCFSTTQSRPDLKAEGAYTKAGTWAPNQEEADMIEMMADRDEAWEESLVDKEEWLNRPVQPPGLLRSGAPLSDMPYHASLWTIAANSIVFLCSQILVECDHNEAACCLDLFVICMTTLFQER